MTVVTRMRTVIVLPGHLRIHFAPKCASAAINSGVHGSGYHPAFPDDEGPEPRFMAVRHPLDRIVSAWAFFCDDEKNFISKQHSLQDLGYKFKMTFEEFLPICLRWHYKNAHTRKQIVFAGPYHIDYLVNLENLDNVWGELQKKIPLLKPMNRSHVSVHKPWEEYYSNESRSYAEDVFREDVELFERANSII